MRKIAFAVNHLGPSHLSYMMMRQTQRQLKEKDDLDAIFFFQSVAPPCLLPPCAIMNIAEMWGFDGVAVATSLTTAQILANCPTPKKKIFYCWDLDWIRLPQKNFEELYSIYGNPKLELVTRTIDYVKPLENAWNKPVRVVENFDIDGLLK